MLIKPRVRGFMCVTTHPAGCRANVQKQIDYVESQAAVDMPKRVLVIGASTGYGLASRITAAFAGGASTIGLFFEKPGNEKKPGTAGWYNSAAFHEFAAQRGLYAKSINGDAFSHAVKRRAIELIKQDLGKVDLVVYSLASPRRQHPDTGVVYSSTLKPVGKAITQRGINTDKAQLQEVTLAAATQEEIDNTVAVMGGEDWQMWIEALDRAGVLADGAKTTAYTYLGEKLTWDIYWHGTIGQAKQDLDKRVIDIRKLLAAHGGDARVSVLQGVVTQASSAIPIMPLYLSLLFKIARERGELEGCIEQIYALFAEGLYSKSPRTDKTGRLRVDDKEMNPQVQGAIEQLWDKVSDENLYQVTDFAFYQREFLRLFGFEIDGIDYAAEVEPLVNIENCESVEA
ncbi:MAG: enoyl-ACP reductase FabV [Pseudomonadales bacterium]